MTKAATRQTFFAGLCPVESAVSVLAESDEESRGAVFTKREVVDFILDLAGYTANKKLYRKRLLEPSVGQGEFLFAACERLLESWNRSGEGVDALSDAMFAVEVHRNSYEMTRTKLVELLSESGFVKRQASRLADRWLRLGDFLLEEIEGRFDVVVGNPPYVRQERIPAALIAEYRRRYSTIYDRADLYVPFFERSLDLLLPKGRLVFICSDRWMKNRYGGPLRQLVAEQFHLRCFIDMVDTPAFNSDVIAYPAITVISREPKAETRIACRPEIDASKLRKLALSLNSQQLTSDPSISSTTISSKDSSPWLFSNGGQLEVLRRLERDFPTIEEAGCKVGIGVATGADKVFIGDFDALDVEPCRKLPLATTRDINSGTIEWRGLGIVNPFAESGKLVDLEQFPRLRRFFEAQADLLKKRHVAKKAPSRWYRTIDRIYPELAEASKLLIPDIKGNAQIVLEEGQLYPHHNLYYITSSEWPLRVLKAILSAGLARLFVAHYSTAMRGGYLRFQAQYLRRIRIPCWSDLPDDLRDALTKAGESNDDDAVVQLGYRALGITDSERSHLTEEAAQLRSSNGS